MIEEMVMLMLNLCHFKCFLDDLIQQISLWIVQKYFDDNVIKMNISSKNNIFFKCKLGTFRNQNMLKQQEKDKYLNNHATFIKRTFCVIHGHFIWFNTPFSKYI